ncbi:MAG: IS3 family transposase [Rikenellaceae bacterium]
MTKRRERREFTEDFKQQMVRLYNSGKSKTEISREYDLTPSALNRWIQRINKTGSTKEADNRTSEEAELIKLRKELQQLQMENDILKQAALIFGRKLIVIKANRHKYSISAMCKCLEISRSTYYYEASSKKDDTPLEQEIKRIFCESKEIYGSRKIKSELQKLDKQVSRRRICRIMKRLGLISVYTVAKFKPQKQQCNESAVVNELDRQFSNQPPNAVIVGDLTYVRVNYTWHYVCILIDLFNREIVGFSAGIHKSAQLVYDAFATIKGNLSEIELFHTDRGSEFKNYLIDEMLDVFQIKRSLSMKGCPYDNAVAEANFKMFKTEFVRGRNFANLEQLRLELADYVHWFNNIRLQGSLDYRTPVEYRALTL